MNVRHIVLFFALISLATHAFAQSSARFSIVGSTIAGGGATTSTGSRFQLASTVGQSVAAAPGSSRFSIQSGFWIWPAPIIFAPTKVGTNFLFSFQTELGKTYTAQYVDSLSANNWQALPNIAGDGTVKTVTNAAPNVLQRFYRLIEN